MKSQRKSSGEKPYALPRANEMVPDNLRRVKDPYTVPGSIPLLDLGPRKNPPTHAEEAMFRDVHHNNVYNSKNL